MRIFGLAAILIAAACFTTVGALAATPKHSKRQQAKLLAQGKYLVTRAAPCSDCHTPRNAQGKFIASRTLAGAPIDVTPNHPVPGWVNTAPPIAGLPYDWTLDQTAHFLETGLAPGGGHAGPPMPEFRFNARDALAIAVYLQSLPKPAPANTHR
ncbi:MAG: c-type cytochrome [Gammaproteobacteria bacterium]